MVRPFINYFSFFFLLWKGLTLSCYGIEFYMEASKKDFYQGENVTVSFVLAAKADTLDVEVVKFPEFQSFWSENTVLRQGPIPLMPTLNVFDPPPRFLPDVPLEDLIRKFKAGRQSADRKAVIGSYVITPMVGREDMKIEPMKIAVRDNQGRADALSLLSQMPDFTIRRLPSPPSDLAQTFKGAVGNFTLELETSEVLYRAGEPSYFRVLLRGEGNYADINEIPITFPEGVELLSTRSQMLQAGQENTKSFEFNISVNAKNPPKLPLITVAFFNPAQNRFQKVDIQAPKLVEAQKLEDLSSGSKALLLPAEKKWSKFRSYLCSWPSVMFQGVLFLFALGQMLFIHLEKLKRKKHLGVSYIRQTKVRAIEGTFQNGRVEEACHELSHFLEDLLRQEFEGERFLSRSEKLKHLESRWGSPARKMIEEYLSKLDHSRFAPDKIPLSNPDIYLKNLLPVVQKLIA